MTAEEGDESAKGPVALLKPLSSTGVVAMKVRDSTIPGQSLELGFPDRAAPFHPTRLTNGPEGLRGGLILGKHRGFSSLFLLEDGSSVFRSVAK